MFFYCICFIMKARNSSGEEHEDFKGLFSTSCPSWCVLYLYYHEVFSQTQPQPTEQAFGLNFHFLITNLRTYVIYPDFHPDVCTTLQCVRQSQMFALKYFSPFNIHVQLSLLRVISTQVR